MDNINQPVETIQPQNNQSVTIALVAGEMSGDLLGAELIQSLRVHYPYATFIGIGGERMIAQGLESWYPLETLSVMGIMAVLKRLPQLLRLRKELVRRLIRQQPQVFIGIDAPDFNLGVARKLKEAHIPAVHYVSPSVWAWRRRRVHGIHRSIDLMLTLFPFEWSFYRRHGIAAEYVGHPAADEIPLQENTADARHKLGTIMNVELTTEDTIVAVLPGSRSAEIQYLLPLFLDTIKWVYEHRKDLKFVIPCANEKRFQEIQSYIKNDAQFHNMPIYLVKGSGKIAMGASNVVLLASGTATLEALLLKKPMVVAYKWHPLTHAIISRLVQINRFALPNILANTDLVPEFIQDTATVSTVGPALLSVINPENTQALKQQFYNIHKELKQNASAGAALAIYSFLSQRQSQNTASPEQSIHIKAGE